MGFIGGIERNQRLQRADMDGRVLVQHLQSGYVDGRDMAVAQEMVNLVQSARPGPFSGIGERMNWDNQMRGAMVVYGQVQNQLAAQNGAGVQQPGLPLPSDLPNPMMTDPAIDYGYNNYPSGGQIVAGAAIGLGLAALLSRGRRDYGFEGRRDMGIRNEIRREEFGGLRNERREERIPFRPEVHNRGGWRR